MNCRCVIDPTGRTPPRLCGVHLAVALQMIDKCAWWAEHYSTRGDWDAGANACAKNILTHILAGRGRVARGEPFDPTSTTMDIDYGPGRRPDIDYNPSGD